MVEERVQLRLSALLAADVVGSSPLMRADEARTLAKQWPLRARNLSGGILPPVCDACSNPATHTSAR